MVKQSTATGIINWSSFSIGQGYQVTFQNGSGSTLNRVTGNIPSSINGLLSATGSVYLINPAGIAVGPNGAIKTGGSFVGSTLDIADDKFRTGGSLTFSGNSTASVVNLGKIGSSRGDVVLIAQTVENNGSIRARKGTAALASGSEVTIRDQAMSDGKIAVSLPAVGGSVRNGGAIRAANAELRAHGGNVFALGLNTNSMIKATGVANKGGRVFLTATGGNVTVSSRVTAQRKQSAAHQSPKSGGQIVVTGDNVTLAAGAKLDASGTTGGTILIGGDRQGGTVAANNFVTFAVANAQNTTVESGATINADGSAGNGGNIVVWSDQATSYAGAISARGGNTVGNGGFAEVSGHEWLDYNGTADLRAPAGKRGTLLLDPSDITISSGGNTATASGTSPRTYSSNSNTSILNATTLMNALGTADVVVDAAGGSGNGNGDITVSTALTWNSANTLFLHAKRNITLNADITATNGGLYLYAGNLHTDFNQPNNLAGTIGTITPNGAINVDTFTMGQGNWVQVGSSLPNFQARHFQVDDRQSFTAALGANYYYWSPFTSFGQSSGTFVRAQGGAGTVGNPYQLFDAYGLQGIAFSMTTGQYSYKLVGNIDLSVIPDFHSIGEDDGSGFYGTLDGQNFTISNLTSTGANNGSAGLFGYTMFGTVKDLKFTNINIGGSNAQYAGLLGRIDTAGSASNVSVVGGTVQSPIEAGGLASELNGGSISNSSVQNVAVTVTGGFGLNSRLNAAGGLVGAMNSGTLTQSYATGTVSGVRSAGGLVGYAQGGTISQSYATSAVNLSVPSGNVGSTASTFGAGGFIGVAQQGLSITQSYATGAVTVTNANSATASVGSFIGANGGTINEAYATGYVNVVSGNAKVGGFAGAASALTSGTPRTGTLTNAYFDTGTTGLTVQTGDSAATTGGLTTAQLQGTLPSGFNTVQASVWSTGAGRYPYFGWRFSTAPDVVTGTAYTNSPSNGGTALAGSSVNLLINGATAAAASTGANGYYYFFTDAGAVSGSTGVLATLTGTTKGNSFTDTGIAGAMSGLDIHGGYLRLASGGATYSSIISNLNTALGSNTGADYLFTTGGVLKTNTNLAINASASNLDINQSITASGTGTVTVAADDMTLSNAITTAGTTVKLMTATAGRGISLGGSGASVLGLSNTELNQITAATLQIGNDGNTSGAISVTGAIAPSTVTNLKLLSGSTVTEMTGASITVTNLAAAGTDVTMNGANSIGTVAINASGNASFGASGNLTIGSVAGTNGVTAGGTARIRATGNLTLDATNGTVSAVGTGDALQLDTGGIFTNNKGSSALAVTGGGRWLVWSGDPANDTRGSLVYGFKQYNATFGTTSVAQATGNGFLYTIAPTLTASLAANVSKVYDGTNTATLTPSNFTTGGAIDGDTVNITNSGGSFSQSNAGTNLTLTVTGISLASAANGAIVVYGYQAPGGGSASSNTASITPKALTITGTKTYDQSASFSTGQLSLSGVLSGETATLTGGSATVSSANAGNYTSFATNTLTVSNSNYAVTGSGITVSATIDKAPLALTATKTYDGTASFTSGQVTASGVLSGDTATLIGGNVTVASKNAGNSTSFASNTLTVSNGNYKVSGTGVTTSATIAKANLTMTAATEAKTYDGTRSVTATPTVGNLQTGDSVTGLAATFDDRNAGSGKTISIASYTVNDGNSGNNYNISTVTTTGSIAKANLTITAAADTKGYDGTTSSSAAPAVGGIQTGDSVTGLSQTFDTKNIGSGKTMSVAGYTVNDGNGGNNYNVSTVTNGSGVITARAVTAAADAFTKTQGQSDPTLTYRITSGGLAAGDSFSGMLTRDPGDSAGTYLIKQGTLALNANYVLTYVGANLTINAAVPNDVFGSYSTPLGPNNGPANPALGPTAGNGNEPGGISVGDNNAGTLSTPLFCAAGDACSQTPFQNNLQYGQWIQFAGAQ